MFRVTTHLSEILEESQKHPVVIFIFSSQCNTSSALSARIEEHMRNKNHPPIYKVTVQNEEKLSARIEEWFGIKHESPQIIALYKGKVTYTDHHQDIDIKKFL